jgi:hypothetical protein
VLTVQQARQKAIHLMADVQDGKDPAQERQQEASTPVVADLTERYLRDHAEQKKKVRSIREDHRLLEKHANSRIRAAEFPTHNAPSDH